MLKDFTIEQGVEGGYRETIVLIHHWGGAKRTLQKHAHFLREIGYATATMTIEINVAKSWLRQKTPIKFFIAHQIQEALDQIQGPIIVYALSSLGAGAFAAMANSSADVKGVICDGGPFCHFYKCSEKLLRIWYKKNRLVSHLFALFSEISWDPRYSHNIKKELGSLPGNFPVLSIRGGKDPLVSSEAIDAYFEKGPHLRLEKYLIPDGKHLDGLSKFPEVYRDRVKVFLQSLSSQ